MKPAADLPIAPARSLRHNTPLHLLLGVVGSIFLAEMLAMAVFTALPALPPFIAALVDAMLLAALMLPVFYALVYRPLIAEIAERERARATLQDSEQRFRAITATAMDAIIMMDTAGQVSFFNAAAEKMFGYSSAEALGQNLHDLIVPVRFHAAHQAALPHFQATGQGAAMGKILEMGAIRKGGTEFPVELSLSAVQLHGTWQAVGLIRDITERKQAEEAIQRERRLLRALIDNLPDSVYIKDAALRKIVANRVDLDIIGASSEADVLGKTDLELFSNEAGARGYADDLALMQSGQPLLNHEEDFVDAHGIRRWLLTSKVPLRDEQGQITGLLGIGRDITARKQADEQLRQLSQAVEHCPVSIVITDLTGRIQYVNPWFSQLTGYTPEEAIGQNPRVLKSGHTRSDEYSRLWQTISTGGTWHGEFHNKKKNGELYWELASISPITDEHGQITHYVAVKEDITERKLAEDSLRENEGRYRARAAELQTIMDAVPAAVWIAHDQMCHVVTGNRAAYKRLRLPPDSNASLTALEEVPRPVHSRICRNGVELPPNDLPLQISAASGIEITDFEEEIVFDDGTVVYEVGNVMPLFDDEGRPRGAVGAFIDITERKVAAQALQRLYQEVQSEKQYLESLMTNNPAATIVITTNNEVVSWNPAAERLFGYPRAEALGRNIDDLIANADLRAEAEEFGRQAVTLGGGVRTITRRMRKDGTLVDVELSAVPVSVDGTLIGALALYHDITELQHAREEAEAATLAKSAFLAMMSHEIRTPMNGVIGMTSLLLDTDLTHEQRDYAETIRASGESLLTIINDILDFSKIEAGRMELERQPFDVRDCVESALDLVVTKARDKGIELAYFIDTPTPATVIGDVTRLRQILINLLGNALKFTDKGEVVVSIDLARTEQHDARMLHTLHVAVKDTGLGIPSDRLDRLFRSFSQVDASTTRKYGGTGLGLAISKRLSELMGGTMWVESVGIPGQGSTFHFTLQAEAAPTQSRVHHLTDQPQLRDRRVLIVDDNDTNRRVLMGQARSWNMLPRETASPREALEWIQRGDPFDLILLDMQMPDMDGVMLATEIRRYRDAHALPMIMLSSLGRKEVGAAEAQFAAYLTKPVKQSMLFDALVEVFAGQPDTAPRREPTAALQFDAQLGERLPLRLLLAEDNAVNQKLALQMLRKMGYRADVAGNGLEVLDALERQPYDVVLMDVQMPELDGLETTRRIRAHRPMGVNQPRIIAMTANAMQGDREACLDAGMDDYIGKPIQVKELQAALERWGQQLRPSEPTLPAEPAAVIDWSKLNDLRALQSEGEADFAQEMISLYVESVPQLMTAIREALVAGDAPSLQRSAHTLKGSSASLGVERLAALCLDLERLGREGIVTGGDALLAEVEQEFNRVQAAFRTQSASA